MCKGGNYFTLSTQYTECFTSGFQVDSSKLESMKYAFLFYTSAINNQCRIVPLTNFPSLSEDLLFP